MSCHSLTIILDGNANDDFVELKKLKNVKNIIEKNENNYKVFLTNTKKHAGNQPQFHLTPFVTKDQLKYIKEHDKLVILKIFDDLFHILSSEKQNIMIPRDELMFLNQEQIEINSVHLGVSETFSSKILPNCPVCIKRLDKSISRINTIKCRDMFHSCCQENCKRISRNCIVCKVLYEQPGKFVCSDCGSSENLWICLICGNLGCGRYKGGHAHNHFTQTGHAFALKLDSHHIWDYTLDKYIHWNIKSEGGTVVDVDEDLNNVALENFFSSSDSQIPDNFINDFTTAQLESQKAYFEERLHSIKNEHKKEILVLQKNQKEEFEVLKNDFNRLNHERKIYFDLSGQLQEHIKKMKIQLTNLSNELETEKKISQGLAKSIDNIHEELNTTKSEKVDLEEQVKDLMKHIEVLDMMGQAGNIPDIVGGKLLIRPPKKKTSTK